VEEIGKTLESIN